MEDLHRSKIEVLRGRQEKQYSNFIDKKAKETTVLEAEFEKDIEKVNRELSAEEEALKLAFKEKKARLEKRWRLEIAIEVAKQEKITGERFAVPPDIT